MWPTAHSRQVAGCLGHLGPKRIWRAMETELKKTACGLLTGSYNRTCPHLLGANSMNKEMGFQQLSAPRHGCQHVTSKALLLSVGWWKPRDLHPSIVTWTGLRDQTQAEGRKLRAASHRHLFPERFHLPLDTKECKTTEP